MSDKCSTTAFFENVISKINVRDVEFIIKRGTLNDWLAKCLLDSIAKYQYADDLCSKCLKLKHSVFSEMIVISTTDREAPDGAIDFLVWANNQMDIILPGEYWSTVFSYADMVNIKKPETYWVEI